MPPSTTTTASLPWRFNSMAIPHAYGRLQFGEDLELHFRTMIGTGANPNVHSVVVIGIEPGWTKRIADGIRETGKEVAEFSIEQKGDFDADSRWALAWFEQHGFTEGEFGVADVLARAKGTAVDGVAEAGIIVSGKRMGT